MRVVFFGTPEFAVPSLAALLDADVDVVAVVTQPDRPASPLAFQPGPAPGEAQRAGGRHSGLATRTAARRGILPAHARPSRRISAWWSRTATCSSRNCSAIPRFGWSTFTRRCCRAGAARHRSSGRCFPAMTRPESRSCGWKPVSTPAPSGSRRSTAISTRRYHRHAHRPPVATRRRDARRDVVREWRSATHPTRKTTDGVTHAPKVHRELARIRWDEPARAVSCRIRAMDPAPGAWTDDRRNGDQDLRRSHRSRATPRRPARSSPTANRLIVATGDRGAVEITEVQPAGKRRVTASGLAARSPSCRLTRGSNETAAAPARVHR